MNPRIIIYAIIGGFLTFYGLFLYLEGYPLYGIPLGLIGILIGLQMIRLIFMSEYIVKEHPDVDLYIDMAQFPSNKTIDIKCLKCGADFITITIREKLERHGGGKFAINKF